MRLRKLIVQGFKSFADRTEFVFDSPITGIVGPNGCGKSNVVDAFKWVLGEQSAKSLRGDAMMDVIFNGSAARKPSGLAEVILVFENPKKPDGSRALHLDVDEVAVGRRLYRDGASEYHLNNGTSRLKDIRELFLDTGVGADAYSVIEQGKVSAMLEANPAERRIIFEEAAGISKYKVKKKEALRKLEKVDQNLLRVNDVVVEVEKQLRSVKLQAGKARVYKEHTTRLEALRLDYCLHEYHTHFQQSVLLRSQLEDVQFRADDLAGDLARQEADLNTAREQFDLLSQSRQRVDYELVAARSAVQAAVQKEHYSEQQLRQLQDQLQNLERDRQTVEQKLSDAAATLEAETARLAELTAAVRQHRDRIDQLQQAFKDGQLKLNQLNRDVEQNKSAVIDLMRRLAGVNNRLGSIEVERKNVGVNQQRIGDRRGVVMAEIEAVLSRRGDVKQKLDSAITAVADATARLEEQKKHAAALGKQIATLTQQLGAAKEHRSGLMSRQKLLTDLEARREGVSEGVKSVLKQRESRFGFVRGLVADALGVDVEHAHVIEAALDGRDQWIVTENLQLALDAGHTFADLTGRVNMLPRTNDLRPASRDPQTNSSGIASGERLHSAAGDSAYNWNVHPHRIRLAADLIRAEGEEANLARHLLGKTVVVDNLKVAADLHRHGPVGFRYVTHHGEVLEADGTLRAGPLTAAMGLLSRRSELLAVTAQIADVDERIARFALQVSQSTTAARDIEEQQSALRNTVYQANTTRVEQSSLLSQLDDKHAALNREHPLLDRELANLLEQFSRLKTEEDRLTGQKSELETDQADRQALIAELSAEHQKLAEELKDSGETLTAARVRLGQANEQQLSCQQTVARLTQSRGELSQQIERLALSLQNTADRRGAIEHDLASARHARDTHARQVEELTEQSRLQTAQVQQANEGVKTLTASVETARRDHSTIEQKLHALQMEAGQLTVRLESLVSRTMEEQQLDLPVKYESFNGSYVPPELDWPAIAAEIKELRDKINRLGSVNVDAISEMDELTTRQGFLATQISDLAASKKQLEELIETINQESSLRFEQTFNTVREHFQGMFRKLFGGGKADVYLETELDQKADTAATVGPDGQPIEGAKPQKKFDILDAGIEIIARPPGKQPATISQLSGGEKTMTCIALLMSIFKSKPSPFCILDEVDAALDEANNQRFNLIIQEFLEQSQFIVITHSKRTMQIADVLYGVTMQEQGVSKRVAVKFDQVDHNGRIAEPAAA